MAAMASIPPMAPAGSRMRLWPSCAADRRRSRSAGSASAPTDITRQSIPLRKTALPCSATADWPATSAISAGLRASRSSSDSTTSISHNLARAASPRPGRQHVLRDPAASDEADRRHFKDPATTISGGRAGASLRVEPHAGELPLRQLLHRIAHAFASEAARAHAAERIGIEPEAAGVVDPERADTQLARYLECGFQARGEAGAL